MGVYTKSKANFTNLDVSTHAKGEDAFRVGIAENSMNIVIDYLTNLYANPAKAVIRELFTNAADAVKLAKSKQISISLKDNTLTVTDYGVGMSAEQLRNNYVTYANSSKTQDFDSVGSFGLGSKSPMAIAPSFTVVSNNGSEENSVIVYRKQDGLFAEITPVEDKKPYSFTRVTVENIKPSDAATIDSYIIENIIPYSSDSYDIVYTSDISNPSDQVSLKSVKAKHTLGDNSSIEYTIYYKDLYTSFVYNTDFHVMVRVNGSVCYPLYRDRVYYKDEDRIPAITVVIEVESGYFSFAPAREELPAGEAKEHLKNIIYPFTCLDLLKDIAKYGDEDKDSVLFASMVARDSRFINYRKLVEVIDSKAANYINGVFNGTVELDPGCEVYYYGRNNASKSTRYKKAQSSLNDLVAMTLNAVRRSFPGSNFSFKREKATCEHLATPAVPYCDEGKMDSSSDHIVRDYLHVIYVYNMKRNRKGELRIPSFFSLLSVKNRYPAKGFNKNPDVMIVFSDSDSPELPEALKPMKNLGFIYEGNDGRYHEGIEVYDASNYYGANSANTGNTRNVDRASRKVSFFIDQPYIDCHGGTRSIVREILTTVGNMNKFADYLVYDPGRSCYCCESFGLINALTSKSVAVACDHLPLYVLDAINNAGVKIVSFDFCNGVFKPSNRAEVLKVVDSSVLDVNASEINGVISSDKWLSELCEWSTTLDKFSFVHYKLQSRLATMRLEHQLNRLNCSLGEKTVKENELPDIFWNSSEFDLDSCYFEDLHASLSAEQAEEFYSHISDELFALMVKNCLDVDHSARRLLCNASDFILEKAFVAYFGISEEAISDFKKKYSDYLYIYHKVEDNGAKSELDKICYETINNEVNDILAAI